MELHEQASHRCRFRQDRTSYEKPLLPFSSKTKRIRQIIRNITVISTEHPQAYRCFKSSTGIENEIQRQIRGYSFLTIHPLSTFRKYWDLIIFFCLSTHMVLVPYAVAFFDDISKQVWSTLAIIDLIVMLCLYIEVILKFLTGFIRMETMQVELGKKKIWKHYLNGSFLIDVVGSLPYVLIVSLVDFKTHDHDFESLERQTSYAQKLHLISIMYLSNVFRYGQIERYFTGIPLILGWGEKTITYTKLVISTFFFLHWLACLRLYIPSFVLLLFDPDIFTGTQFEGNLTEEILKLGLNRRLIQDVENVLTANETKANYTNFEKYVRSFAITTKMSLQCGYGAETDDSSVQMLMSIAIIILGWTYFAYCTVICMRMIISSEISENKYEAAYNEIEIYIRAKHIPKHLKEKIFAYYAIKYKENYFNEEAITNVLSKRLKQEILMHTCQTLVTKVYLFNNLPKNLIQEIVKCLILEIFLPYEIVLQGDTEGDSMFFIASGTAAVYSLDGREICHLIDGDHFGEISLLIKGKRRTATIISLETCEIYKLERKDFDRIVPPNSDLYERMQKIAIERMGKKHVSKKRESVRVMKTFIN